MKSARTCWRSGGAGCAYCQRTDVPLQLEHLAPRSHGGADAVWNLTLRACRDCTGRKGNQTAAEFGFPALEAARKRPLRDAAAVNSTRWALSPSSCSALSTSVSAVGCRGMVISGEVTTLGNTPSEWRFRSVYGSQSISHLF